MKTLLLAALLLPACGAVPVPPNDAGDAPDAAADTPDAACGIWYDPAGGECTDTCTHLPVTCDAGTD